VSGSSDTGCSSNKGPSLDSVNFDDRASNIWGKSQEESAFGRLLMETPYICFSFQSRPICLRMFLRQMNSRQLFAVFMKARRASAGCTELKAARLPVRRMAIIGTAVAQKRRSRQ
jgi:hypothetical protein